MFYVKSQIGPILLADLRSILPLPVLPIKLIKLQSLNVEILKHSNLQ